MLTVKVMSPGGKEEIRCGATVGFNPKQQSISVAGVDENIFLQEGEVAYVMNPSGKTISHYEHKKAGTGKSGAYLVTSLDPRV